MTNGSETDTDCGGGVCGGCLVGDTCDGDPDCAGGLLCGGSNTCEVP
jgi:hypothetical protein